MPYIHTFCSVPLSNAGRKRTEKLTKSEMSSDMQFLSRERLAAEQEKIKN